MTTFVFNDLKDITSHIFLKDTFDSFLLYEAEFVTGTMISIDGTLQKEFFDNDELEQLHDTDYISWQKIKPLCFSVIKGKKLPLSFKITFKMPSEIMERFTAQNHSALSNAGLTGLLINLKYDNNRLTAVTAASISNFTLDRSYEKAWDDMVLNFFKEKNILIENL